MRAMCDSGWMKLLFKLYLLGQLIAMPFMVGAVGDVLSSGSESAPTAPAPNTQAEVEQKILSAHELCDSLHGTALNSVQDDIQQLRFITADLYGEEVVDDCFAEQTFGR